MKKIYFLSGLPRSGNTLLSAILNQNPSIYSSPLSPLLDNLLMLNSQKSSESALVTDFEENMNNAMTAYVSGYYKNCAKDIIFDRSKGWGDKESIVLAYKHLGNLPKVVYTVRDIPSILTSFISLLGVQENTYVDKSIKTLGRKPYGKQTNDDLRCDWLMDGQIRNSLIVLDELLKMQVPVCLVEYDDLVMNTQETLNKIYDFIEIDRWKHDLSNIKKIEIENLDIVGLPSNLHDIRPIIQKQSLLPENVLSKTTLDKYSNLEFWRS